MGSQSHWYIGGVQRTAILFICLVTLDTSVNHRSNALHPFGQTRLALQLQHWLFCYCSAVSRTLTRKREHPVSYCAWHRRWQGRQKTLEDLNLLLPGSWWQGGTREGHLCAFLPSTIAAGTTHTMSPPSQMQHGHLDFGSLTRTRRDEDISAPWQCAALLCSVLPVPCCHSCMQSQQHLGAALGRWVWLMFSLTCWKTKKCKFKGRNISLEIHRGYISNNTKCSGWSHSGEESHGTLCLRCFLSFTFFIFFVAAAEINRHRQDPAGLCPHLRILFY